MLHDDKRTIDGTACIAAQGGHGMETLVFAPPVPVGELG
jgi:hypothetical protein